MRLDLRSKLYLAVVPALFAAAFGILLWTLANFAQSGLAIALVGFAGAVVTAAFQYRAAKDKEVEARLFSEKQAIYTELTHTIMSFLQIDNDQARTSQDETTRKLKEIRAKLIIWGSFDTLRTLDKMGEINDDVSGDGLPSGLIWLGNILSHMRKDLGHRDPEGSAAEIALGFLIPSDRARLRDRLRRKSRSSGYNST